MDELHSERCDSEELDPTLRLRIKKCRTTHSSSDDDTPHIPEPQMSEVNVLNLQIKLLNMKRKNQELLFINKKWAEQYSLLSQCCERKITELNRLKHNEQRKEEKEKTEDFMFLTTNSTEYTQEFELMSRLQEADREIERLKMRCDTLTGREQQLEEEIRRLNKVQHRTQQSLALQESKQTEIIWKYQAQVYKEDFLKERRDRDKLKEKYAELQERFKKSHADLHFYKAQVQWGPSCAPTSGSSPQR
ncbi:TNFAIP3-interacting protein 3-like [Hoplias malabaricus]|uniref:TNFAIP3-interacting protein 3-like n=1 Tax=Hoplias malabaricus TaxID=27720 RepID=UPI0034621E00